LSGKEGEVCWFIKGLDELIELSSYRDGMLANSWGVLQFIKGNITELGEDLLISWEGFEKAEKLNLKP